MVRGLLVRSPCARAATVSTAVREGGRGTQARRSERTKGGAQEEGHAAYRRGVDGPGVGEKAEGVGVRRCCHGPTALWLRGWRRAEVGGGYPGRGGAHVQQVRRRRVLRTHLPGPYDRAESSVMECVMAEACRV